MRRFLLGFIMGAASMYWYVNHGEETLAKVRLWFERASQDYSLKEPPGDRAGAWR